VDLQPKIFEEFYAFFVPNLIKPPVKSNFACSGIQLDRAGWHVEIYRMPRGDSLSVWFYTHPNRGPKWAKSYVKFTNPSQDS
jgi:hypothetical protein